MLAGLADFVGRAEPEIAANAMVCAVNQAAYLLKRRTESQARRFMREGGFTENLYRKRVQAGNARRVDRRDRSDRPDRSDRSDSK
jgi:four helix bundle suffix protein